MITSDELQALFRARTEKGPLLVSDYCRVCPVRLRRIPAGHTAGAVESGRADVGAAYRRRVAGGGGGVSEQEGERCS